MTTGRPLDHIVVALRDLDAAARTYEALGFTLTPRAAHEDRMGTSNRLAQFAGHNFIELLEVDRPAALAPHDFSQDPPFFSFGAQNKAAVAERDGISMLVFAGEDARADLAAFEAAGVPSYAPFDFQRQARQPDGREVTVAFSLAFATSPDMPRLAFFVCENRAPEHFWKPAFQDHANGARGVRAVYLASPEPARDAAFLARMFGGAVTDLPEGQEVACGPSQSLRVLHPQAIAARDPSLAAALAPGPLLAGIALDTPEARPLTPATEACGLFIEWGGA